MKEVEISVARNTFRNILPENKTTIREDLEKVGKAFHSFLNSSTEREFRDKVKGLDFNEGLFLKIIMKSEDIPLDLERYCMIIAIDHAKEISRRRKVQESLPTSQAIH